MKKKYIRPEFRMKVVDNTNIIATSISAEASDNDSRILDLSISDDKEKEVESGDDVL